MRQNVCLLEYLKEYVYDDGLKKQDRTYAVYNLFMHPITQTKHQPSQGTVPKNTVDLRANMFPYNIAYHYPQQQQRKNSRLAARYHGNPQDP